MDKKTEDTLIHAKGIKRTLTVEKTSYTRAEIRYCIDKMLENLAERDAMTRIGIGDGYWILIIARDQNQSRAIAESIAQAIISW